MLSMFGRVTLKKKYISMLPVLKNDRFKKWSPG